MPDPRTRWWLLAGALAILGVVLLVLGLGSGPRSPEADPQRGAAPEPTSLPQVAITASSRATDPRPAQGPSTRRPVRPRATPSQDGSSALRLAKPLTRSVAPAHLSIPAIGVSHDLMQLGLNPDHTVEVPPHARSEVPGWFRLGPTPGTLGSAVVLGHVDSLRGPAVFYRLKQLQDGDRVDVRLVDGTVAHFAVRSVATYPNADFPAQQVYGPHGFAGLNLVTCGGTYDSARGGYQSNVVVYTSLVGTSRA